MPLRSRSVPLQFILISALYAAIGILIWVRYFPDMNAVEFITYRTAAVALLNGHSPYPALAGDAISGGHAFVYPLLVAIGFLPFGLLPLHLGVFLYRLGLFVALFVAGALAGRTRGIAVMTFALWATPTITALQVGSLEPLFFLALVLVWRYWRRLVTSGAILGSVAVAKLYLAPLLLIVLIARRLRRTLSAFVGVAVWVPLVLAFIPGMATYIAIVTHLSAHEASSGWSFQSAVAPVVGTGHLGELLGATIAVALMAPGLWGDYRRARHEPNWEPDLSTFGRYVVVALIASPIVWSHYYVLVVLVILGRQGVMRQALFTLLTWVIVTPDTVPAHGRYLGIGLAAVGLLLAGTTIHPRRQRLGPLVRSWSFESRCGLDHLGLGAGIIAAALIIASITIAPGVAGAGIAQLTMVGYLLYASRTSTTPASRDHLTVSASAPSS
ncbi:MAG: glycosyltransferase family 87 protein [Acidimicrobiales bacterium]